MTKEKEQSTEAAVPDIREHRDYWQRSCRAVEYGRYVNVLLRGSGHKAPRAPQNLFSIAGLERELRHRLGDAGFVQRALRNAAAQP